ncbi:MAG: PQQ-binding-like beta-propeller repeat protein, partial [Pirellulales bacterium]|nr:PQQ-binding-like beta-propeller repeat protein [Pirellulales bacterium]
VPRVNLYSLAIDGALECRNAETGESIWVTRVGNRELKYGAMGVDEKFITVVNGGNLIQVDVSNGEVIEEVSTIGTPLHGAVMSGHFALVPTIRNGVEGYLMRDLKVDPFMEIVAGYALALPQASPDSTRVVWATDRGFVYAMEMSGTPSVMFRLDTDGIVSGRVASAPRDRFYFGSESGQVYGIHATRTGTVEWSRPFGEPFYDQPLIAGEQLLIRSGYGNLFSLGTVDGISTWENTVPGIDEVMGVIGDRVFVRKLSGTMAVLDLQSGDTVGNYPQIQPGRLLINTLTDRLYMVSEGGAVQCLRPVGAEMPNFTRPPEVKPKTEEKAADPEPPATTNEQPFPADNNPFDTPPGNPFDTPGEDDNPFGGNPF